MSMHCENMANAPLKGSLCYPLGTQSCMLMEMGEGLKKGTTIRDLGLTFILLGVGATLGRLFLDIRANLVQRQIDP